MTEFKGYNGWRNRSTWLVPLHIDNNYGMYQAKTMLLDSMESCSPAEAMAIANMFFQAELPDGGDWDEVDWVEIADHWHEEIMERIDNE